MSSTQPNTPQSKVLLMGRAAAGKTSIRSIIFANYLARETSRLHPTNQVEHCNLRFLGSLQLNLWDCGGQDVFMENYFESQRDHIFRDVHVLIYVLGSAGSITASNQRGIHDQRGGLDSRGSTTMNENAKSEVNKDLTYLRNTINSLSQLSPEAQVFVFVHKIDLVPEHMRQLVFAEYTNEIRAIAPNASIFSTSIWDETLFRAWSMIVHSLIPNVDFLEKQLEDFCKICDADEVVLFEKATFVVISSSTQKTMHDQHRFEKISNIVKQFKLSCGKQQSSFKSLLVQNRMFSAFIERFTHNTFLMLIVSNKAVHPAATMTNIDVARRHFEKLSSLGFGAHL